MGRNASDRDPLLDRVIQEQFGSAADVRRAYWQIRQPLRAEPIVTYELRGKIDMAKT